MDFLRITTRSLRSSVDFYRRVFGFQIDEEVSDRLEYNTLLTNACRDVYVAILERCRWNSAAPAPSMRSSFAVDDIDEVREAIWDLGVTIADATTLPGYSEPWRRKRSFLIRDPDGNEIELVERIAQKPVRATNFAIG